MLVSFAVKCIGIVGSKIEKITANGLRRQVRPDELWRITKRRAELKKTARLT